MGEVNVIVRSTDQGSQNISKFGSKLEGLSSTGLKVGAAMGAASLAFVGIQRAVQGAWDVLQDGAALELANSRFENLAASIGTTAGALKGDMSEATQGMMSNAQMVASASDIISLGLAGSGEEVVRLSSLVGQLGWDMQTLTLTMANDSMLRLDALGLSMTDVKERMEALKAAGMDADKAFDLAVIEAGEAKIQLLGSAAETSAGKMQKATASISNLTDALKIQAVQIADTIGLFEILNNFAGTADMRSTLLDMKEAGQLTTRQFDELFTQLRYAGPESVAATLNEMGKMKDGLTGVNNELLYNQQAWAAWATGVKIAATEGDGFVSSAIASGRALSEWTDDAKDAALEAGKVGDAFAGIDMAGITGATQSGIWAVAGNHIQSILDEAAAEGEAAHKAAAEEIAAAYEEAALRMGSAFATELNAEVKINFGDMDAMSGQAWSMAQAFGLTVEEMGNVGIALGEITPEMAEAATKAVIFKEAFGNLLGQFKAGDIDAAGLTTAFDNLISDLNSKSLIEIQVELKQKVNPARDLWAGLPAEERVKEIEIPVKFTPEETALQAALGMIDGIPDNDQKIITFDAEYDAVTKAVGDVQTAITAIDATVTMTPDTQEVYKEISIIDQSRLTVYVDFVPTGAPELPGKAAGGPVQGGSGYIIGENGPEIFVPWTSGTVIPNHKIGRGGGGGDVQLSVQNYFYGQTTGADVDRALDDATRQMMRRLQQVIA